MGSNLSILYALVYTRKDVYFLYNRVGCIEIELPMKPKTSSLHKGVSNVSTYCQRSDG